MRLDLISGGVIMSRTVRAILLSIIMLALIVGAAQAYQGQQQDPQRRGSIRGTVYEDKNADGKCVGTGEPSLPGVTIEFVSADGETVVYLGSGDNGTYGLVAAGLGTWTVTAKPPAGWAVTSQNPIEAFLGVEQLLVLGVDFCVVKGAGTSGTGTSGAVVLPESGAAVSSVLIAALISGSSLMFAGAGLEWRRRRSR
jgi:hypothetical protein